MYYHYVFQSTGMSYVEDKSARDFSGLISLIRHTVLRFYGDGFRTNTRFSGLVIRFDRKCVLITLGYMSAPCLRKCWDIPSYGQFDLA